MPQADEYRCRAAQRDIDHAEARRLRQQLERESQLFGAMDGAMKFVKGDVIAGIVIILVNLVGGFAVGTLQHDMSLGDAAAPTRC
ncbi:FHIPEP family type III secretion protein [Mesorhizobium calcicola]|uniref:FHIPEP family type III secretion protein n=1 Tax=Mesorhizobium calcicola TaxID=1300310 RepID=A0ABW4W605_9HYPH